MDPSSELGVALRDFQRDLRVRNRAARTIKSYTDAVTQLADHAGASTVADLDRDAVMDFLDAEQARNKPATVAVKYRSLQQWFRWLAEEGEITVSPMERMTPPSVPEQPPEVLTLDEVRAILTACDGKEFADRRDTAIVRVLFDTGIRLAECAGLGVGDVDLDLDVLTVHGKGSRIRTAPFGDNTGRALSRYLRARAKHRHADSDALWLGDQGGLTDSGVTQVLRRRGRQAGVDGLRAHRFRHTWAHLLRLEGMDDDALMQLAGWRSRDMLQKYGASAAGERARQAHKRLGPGDKL